MRVGEFRGLAGRLAVDQARGPMGVERHHPVPDDLPRDPADPGRRGAGGSVIDRGQRQETPRLQAVLRRAGDRAQPIGIKVCPERNRHGEPPSFATLNQTRFALKTLPSHALRDLVLDERYAEATTPAIKDLLRLAGAYIAW